MLNTNDVFTVRIIVPNYYDITIEMTEFDRKICSACSAFLENPSNIFDGTKILGVKSNLNSVSSNKSIIYKIYDYIIDRKEFEDNMLLTTIEGNVNAYFKHYNPSYYNFFKVIVDGKVLIGNLNIFDDSATTRKLE